MKRKSLLTPFIVCLADTQTSFPLVHVVLPICLFIVGGCTCTHLEITQKIGETKKNNVIALLAIVGKHIVGTMLAILASTYELVVSD